MDGFVMANVRKMEIAGSGNGDFPAGNAECGHQIHSIAVSTSGSAVSRHRYAYNAIPLPSEPVEGKYCDQKGKGAVQSSRNPYHRRPAVYVCKS